MYGYALIKLGQREKGRPCPQEKFLDLKTEKEENRLFFFVPPKRIDGLTEVRKTMTKALHASVASEGIVDNLEKGISKYCWILLV